MEWFDTWLTTYFGDLGRDAQSGLEQALKRSDRLLLCGLNAVNAVMETYVQPSFDKIELDIINMQLQEKEQQIVEGAPTTAIQRRGNYNAEVPLVPLAA